MAITVPFNAPQFTDEYDGVKMRQLIDELDRIHSALTRDVDTGGGGSGVTSFNTRTGDVLPVQADYDSFFLTQAEGDAAYAAINNVVNSFNGRQGTVVPALGDYAAIAETYTVLQTFDAGIEVDLAQPISWVNAASTPVEMLIFSDGGALDPLYNDVLLLVDFEDGVDGSTAYFDKGPSTLTITNNTNSEVDTARAKYGTRSMLCPDGTGDGFEVADSTSWDLAGDFTLELDVYFDSFDTENQYLIEKRNGGGTQAGYTILLDVNEKFRFLQWAGSGGTESVNLTGTTTALTGQWYTVRVTCENDLVSLYVNGTREDQATRGAVGLNNEDVYFGFYHLATTESLRGSMDNIRVTLASRGTGPSYTLPTDSYPTAQGIGGLTIGDQAYLTTIDSDLDVLGTISISGVPLLPPPAGTVTDSTQRWSGAAWVEETGLRITDTGFLISEAGLEVQASTPGLTLRETDQAADEKEWALAGFGSDLVIQTQTDVGAAGSELLRAVRGVGTAITSLDITPSVNISGDLTVGGFTDNIDFNPGTVFDIEFGSLVTDVRYGVASSAARHIFGAPIYVPESSGGTNEIGWGQFYARPEAGDAQTPIFRDAAGTEYELNDGGVTTFNGRSGAVTPQQADYDSFFLTPTEGDTAYVNITGDSMTGPLSVTGATEVATFYSQLASGNISVGRDSNQRLQISVDDTIATLTHDQDEPTVTNHETHFDIVSPTAGVKSYRWRFDGADEMVLTEDEGLTISAPTPEMNLVETDSVTDRGRWAIGVSGETLTLSTETDAGGAGVDAISINRGPTTSVSSIALAEQLFIGSITERIELKPGTTVDMDFGSLTTLARFGVASNVNQFQFGGAIYVAEQTVASNIAGSTQIYAVGPGGNVFARNDASNDWDLTYGNASNPVGTTGLADNAATNAKLANMAASRIKGRLSTTGDPQDLTGAQVNTILPNFTSSLDGLAPSSGGGTVNYLRADGTWADPLSATGDPGPEIYFNTSGNSITSATVWKDDLTIVNISLDADSYYFFELSGFLLNQTSGLQGRFQFSSNPQDDGGLTWTSRTGRTSSEGGQENDIESSFTISNTDTFAIRYYYHGQGWFRTNATTGGTLKLQWKRLSGTANAVDVGIGTTLRLYKI